MSNVSHYDNLAMHRELGGVDTDEELASGTHGWDLNKSWKGYSAIARDLVPVKALRRLAQGIYQTRPITRRYIEFKALGGAIKKKTKSETAFWFRDALWWILSDRFFDPDKDSPEKIQAILETSRQDHDEFIEMMGDSFAGLYPG